MAVLARILYGICSSLINHWSRSAESRAETQVRHHYDDYLLIANLGKDLPSLQVKTWSTFLS
ncbi:hypothetical protein BT96DRAFT_305849 [Gymnopus androsaceus JB14]|uniref:Uncharacterized protein n=1 Tax=Gymnopus androsaceus JB14 TaxID=1447944 RepID=A0A6A4IAS5_9AGAR|nr:hypothetical protein BT96DRAFT_305849 [Gymnopus androsaceus JB14]